MKNTRKRLLASLLALYMTVGLVPAQAVQSEPASESPDAAITQTEPTEEASEEEPTLKHEAAFLAGYATSGTCGAEGNEASVTWNIDTAAYTFTISGSGAMMDYAKATDAPWYEWVNQYSYKGGKRLSLVIGEGVTEIYDLQYIKINGISFPSTLEKIGDSCFSAQSVVSGYDSSGEYTQNKYPLEVELPASVTYIGDYAFSGWASLDRLVIKNPDAYFGEAAFSSAYYMITAVLPEGMTYIPDSFFKGNVRLESVTLPDTVTSIGEYAFYNNQVAPLTLPSGLVSVGAFAFQSCQNLNVSRFPDTVVTIGTKAFYGCKKMTDFHITAAMISQGGSIGSNAFQGTSISGHLTIPDNVTLADEALAACGITGVTLPATTDNIGNGILNNCRNITSVTIPEGWTRVPNETFLFCSGLKTVHWPSTPLEIGSDAFSSTGITELTLPANITKLNGSVFSSCESLKTLTIENPDLKLNGGHSFAWCSALEQVNLPEGMERLHASMFSGCDSLTQIDLPDSIIDIASSTFSGSGLTSITLPDGITSLSGQNFESCTSLTEVVLPANLARIGFRAFHNTTSLKSIVIPESVNYLGGDAFEDSGVTQVRFLGDAPNLDTSNTSFEIFSPNATLYYTAGKAGWTTPEWNGFPAYPVLGKAEFHDDGYYAPVDLYHFAFQTEDGPLDGVTVSYQGTSQPCEAGQSEIAVGMSPVAGEFVTFTREGYHDVTLPTEVLSSFNTIQFTPTGGTAPFIQSAYAHHGSGTYTDLIHDTFSFTGSSTTETTSVYIDVNWNAVPTGKVYLSTTLSPQDGWELEEDFYNAGFLSIKMHAGDDLYLLAAANGLVADAVKLNAIILETVHEQALDIGESAEISVTPSGQNDVSVLLGKMKFGYDFFDCLPAEIEVEQDGTVKALLGFKAKDDNPLDKKFGAFYDSVRDMMFHTGDESQKPGLPMDSLTDLLADRGMEPTIGMAKFGIEGAYSTFGYAEGKLVFDPMTGKPGFVFHEGAIAVSLEGKAEQSFQFYVLQHPVYFVGSIGNKFTFSIPLVSNPEADAPLVPPYHLGKIKDELEVKLSAGLGWDKILAAGVYGEGAGTLEGYLPFEFESSYLKFESSLGLEAEAFSIFETNIPVFQGEFYVWGEDNASNFALRRMSQMDFSPISRDYLDAPSPISLFSVEEENTALTQSLIDDGIYPSADVQFLSTKNGAQYAVWTDDAGTAVRSEDNNRTKLYYTYRYNPTYDWNTIRPLILPNKTDDDGTADFNPVLKEVDGMVYVLWQNARCALTAEDDVTTLPALLDISCASCYAGSGNFNLVGTVGTENYDTTATVCVIDDTPYVVWASNSANSAFEGTGTYSIHRQALSKDAEMETLVTGLNLVDAVEAEGETIWYSTDTDAESDAMTDYAVFCYDGESVAQISESGATKPALVNGVLTWYENGSIRVGEQSVALAADTDRYQYLVSPSGMQVVVYAVDHNLRQTTLYASFDDGTGWGDPIPLSGVTGNIRSFDAAFDKNGALCVLACERALDPDAANYLFGTATLNLYTVTPYADLAITNATYLSNSLVKGGTLDLVVDVVNNGMSAASILNVCAFNGSESLAGGSYEHFLPSGQSGQLYLSVPLDDPTALTDLKVEVVAGGYTDHTPEDNIASVTLRLSDISVEGSQLTGFGESLTAHTMVVNRGQTDLTNLTVTLYAEDGETILASQNLETLDVGEAKVVSFPVTAGEDVQLLHIRAVAEGLDVTQENLAANNEVTIRVEKAPSVDTPISIDSTVSKNTDGSVSVATYATAPEGSGYNVIIAGYDSDKHMVDVITSDSPFAGGSLTGQGIVKVKIFGLDQDLKPITDVIEYDV